MANINYKELYSLQDKVLDCVFSVENNFYLTGGTCLSRFYLEKRYSDDLDFFSISNDRFSISIKNILSELNSQFNCKQMVSSKDFARIEVNNILQLDFVNEFLPRLGEPQILKSGLIIDTIDNILANKLTAIMGRDTPKDVFDIYLISKTYKFHWNEIIEAAQKKSQFALEDLIVRLESFPSLMLDSLSLVDSDYLNTFENDLPKLIEKIRLKKNNDPQ